MIIMEGLKRVVLKLWHPGCWSIETTKSHHDVYLVVAGAFKIGKEIRANFRLVAESYEALKSYIQDIKSFNRLAKDVFVIGKNDLEAYIHGRFPTESTFYENVFSLEFMPTNITIHKGNEYWTVLVYEDKLKETLKKLSQLKDVRFEVESISKLKSLEDETPADIIDEISLTLSAKQKRVLVEAYKSGYFEWPRRMNLNELAGRFGIAKSTCLHHIRTAEQKILKRFIEEIKEREAHLSDN
jgi:hypothetical protein